MPAAPLPIFSEYVTKGLLGNVSAFPLRRIRIPQASLVRRTTGKVQHYYPYDDETKRDHLYARN